MSDLQEKQQAVAEPAEANDFEKVFALLLSGMSAIDAVVHSSEAVHTRGDRALFTNGVALALLSLTVTDLKQKLAALGVSLPAFDDATLLKMSEQVNGKAPSREVKRRGREAKFRRQRDAELAQDGDVQTEERFTRKRYKLPGTGSRKRKGWRG